MGSERITEIKTIKFNADCVENPIFLTWVSADGGVNAWLFGRTQTEADKITGGDIFEPFVDDLEVATSNQEYLSKDVQPQIILGADNLEIEDVLGIRGLLRAAKVEMLMNNDTWETEGPIWQTVLVQPGTFKIRETMENKSRIEFTINTIKPYQPNQ